MAPLSARGEVLESGGKALPVRHILEAEPRAATIVEIGQRGVAPALQCDQIVSLLHAIDDVAVGYIEDRAAYMYSGQ